MTDVLPVFSRLGLTHNDAKTYLALLQKGKCSVGAVIAHSQLQSSRVYESLQHLVDAGLVNYVFIGKHRLYQAEPPERLLAIAQAITDETRSALPLIADLTLADSKEPSARVYQGYSGLRAVFERVLENLKKGDEHLVFAAVQEPEHFVAYFNHWNERRVKKGIRMRIAFARSAAQQITTTATRLVKYKEIPDELATPAVINVFGDSVAIILWLKQPFAFVIESKEAAASFTTYFEIMWKYGNRPSR